MTKFESIGIIKNDSKYDSGVVELFEHDIRAMKARGYWTRDELIDLFNKTILEFAHKETSKFLDSRM